MAHHEAIEFFLINDIKEVDRKSRPPIEMAAKVQNTTGFLFYKFKKEFLFYILCIIAVGHDRPVKWTVHETRDGRAYINTWHKQRNSF